MGNNGHGFDNVGDIVQYLNAKAFKDLNLNMKEFIKYVSKEKNLLVNNSTVIYSSEETNNKLKQDFYITINGNRFGVSCQMGNGNSVHQEKIEDFIKFISLSLDASREICDLWRIFAWGDGTTTGKAPVIKNDDGSVVGRFGNTLYKKLFPVERRKLQAFIDAHMRELLEHIFFVGKYDSNVDFVLHGTVKNARWVSKDKILDYNILHPKANSSACFTIGRMTTQQWNASLKGSQEDRRGQLQHKYSCMREDFALLMEQSATNVGTFAGDGEEFNLTQLMNSQKQNIMWKVLLPMASNYEEYYMVKVSTNQISKLSNKVVKTKSDAYVIKAKLSREFLLSKEYAFDENDLDGIDYEAIDYTGISIKLKNSKSYTYQKFTIESFCKAFCNSLVNPKLVMAMALVYSRETEINKNRIMANDFGFDYDWFVREASNNTTKLAQPSSKDFWDGVRGWAQKKIIDAILVNDNLAKNIVLGTEWFEEPYCASYVYSEGVLSNNFSKNLSVTNGSGRSGGNYTIVIKPK